MITTAKIQKWGNSQGIRIPKYFLEAINWKDNESVEIQEHKGTLIIKRIKTEQRRKNIKELFADFNGQYEPVDVKWGKSVGEEIW